MMLLVACGGRTQIAETQISEAKAVVKVEVKPTPTNVTPTTSETNLSDSIECTVSEHSLNVSCKAPRGISGQWMSNATTHTSEGSAFEFSIESQVSEIVVELEVCVTNGCNVVTVYIDPPPLDALKAEGQGEQKVVFWNERPSDISKCTTDFRFSHQLANPEVVAQMMFGPGIPRLLACTWMG